MSDKEDSEPEQEVEEKQADDVSSPDVQTKYRLAADIATNALKAVIAACKPGALVVELCQAGDDSITTATGKIYKGKKVEKGIGFPTCVSVNHIVGHFSPEATDTTTIKEGDLVKIDLGAHIDGYIAVAAHTIKVGKDGESKEAITGKEADVLMAAHLAGEAALRLLRPGNKNVQVSEAIEKIAAEFGVVPVAGVLSHQMSRFVIDGEKCIIGKEDKEQKVAECEFAPFEVYAIDIVMTTGKGTPKEIDARTTVYKRAPDTTYSLKMKASRNVFNDIKTKYPTFPFTIRALNEKTVRFGINECFKHELVHAYPVLHEKEGEHVAHFKCTALITNNGVAKISGLPLDLSKIQSEFKVKDEGMKAILALGLGGKKKKKKKKKK